MLCYQCFRFQMVSRRVRRKRKRETKRRGAKEWEKTRKSWGSWRVRSEEKEYVQLEEEKRNRRMETEEVG